jgi:hypothetical protein
VVRALEGLPQAERLRWLDLLSYIHALVYHGREAKERDDLQAHIAKSVQSDPHRQEVTSMGKTIADMFKEEGTLKARHEMLLGLLDAKFGQLPAGVIASVEACPDTAQLDAWGKALLKARRLSDVGIPSQG